MALVSPSNSKNHTRNIPVSSIAVIDFAVEEKTFSSESDPVKKSQRNCIDISSHDLQHNSAHNWVDILIGSLLL